MFADPQKNIEQVGITEGMYVADLGAGSGFYTLASARKVKEAGKVYAVDIQDGLLARIRDAAAQEGISGSIETLHGDLEHVGGSKIGDGVIDLVIISNILFQLDQKETVFQEAFRILKNGGKVLVIDWQGAFSGMGPEASQVVSEDAAKKLATEAGFTYDRGIDAGQYHYGFICTKT